MVVAVVIAMIVLTTRAAMITVVLLTTMIAVIVLATSTTVLTMLAAVITMIVTTMVVAHAWLMDDEAHICRGCGAQTDHVHARGEVELHDVRSGGALLRCVRAHLGRQHVALGVGDLDGHLGGEHEDVLARRLRVEVHHAAEGAIAVVGESQTVVSVRRGDVGGLVATEGDVGEGAAFHVITGEGHLVEARVATFATMHVLTTAAGSATTSTRGATAVTIIIVTAEAHEGEGQHERRGLQKMTGNVHSASPRTGSLILDTAR